MSHGSAFTELLVVAGVSLAVLALVGAAPTLRLRVGDILVLAGSHAQMEEAFRRLSPRSSAAPMAEEGEAQKPIV